MKLSKEIKDGLKQYLKDKLNKPDQKAIIIAPYQLSSSDIDMIKSKVAEMKGLNIQIEIDKNILAGFIIKIDSKVWDYSLASKLNSLFVH